MKVIEIPMNVKNYIHNRWISRSHVLEADPKHLAPGQYQDLDYRILHCVFNELVKFVEIEQAHLNFNWYFTYRENLPWYNINKYRKNRTFRSSAAGLDMLDESGHDQDIRELYNWWTTARPGRPDSIQASGLEDYYTYCRLTFIDNSSYFCIDMYDDRYTKQMVNMMHNNMTQIDVNYEAEDTAMLVKLIKIRGSLWT